MTNCLNKTGSASLSEADLRSFGRSTGLRLKGKDPEKYGSIVRALEAGCSLRELARIFKISKNTAGAICLRELGQEGLKKATIRNLQRLVHESSSDLLDSIDDLSPMQKATVMGIAADKLDGMTEPRLETPSLQVNQIQLTANISDEAVSRLVETAINNSAKKTIGV
jgi:hypothetical protein